MRIFKTRWFNRWARKEGIGDASLREAVAEIEAGQFDADLGSQVYKKRVAKPGGGKSSGWRTLVAFRIKDKAFYVYGFAKNARDNIDAKELKALKRLAKNLFGYSDDELQETLEKLELIEVNDHE